MNELTTTPVRLREWRPDDEAQVLALLDRSLGGGPAGVRSPAFFAWKHLDNPFGTSLMLVAEADGVIVGLRTLMRWRLLLGTRTLRAVRAVDTATDPAHRGRGVFRQLTTHALDLLRADTDLVFNTPNEQSLPGYLRLGWEPVGRLPIHVRVRHPVRLARHLRQLGITHTPRRDAPRVTAPPAGALLDEVDLEHLLVDDGRAPQRVHTATTPQVVRWRYADAPGLDYRAVGDVETGLALFRVRPRGRTWETTIAEVLPRPDRRDATRALLHRVADAADTDHLTLHVGTDARLRADARLAGFVRAPGGVLLVHRRVEGPLPPTVADRRSWDLSLGDIEVF